MSRKMSQDDEWSRKYAADLRQALEESTRHAPSSQTPPSITINAAERVVTSLPSPPYSASSSKTASPESADAKIPRRPVSTPKVSSREPSRASSTASSRPPPPPYSSIAPRTPPSPSQPGDPARRPHQYKTARPAPSPSHRPAHSTRTARPPGAPPAMSASASGRSRAPNSTSGDRARHSKSVPHRSRHRRGRSYPDSIDALDTIGGGYHHDGPYEATLASRNMNTKYSPLAAVRDSNMEAIRATPAEFIRDSLDRHVPLQGTATIPSGSAGFGGKVMNYEEGTDMMRGDQPGGGAYKRWDFLSYHPDDLKGKGEPSFTYDRLTREKQRDDLLKPDNHSGQYEMQTQRVRSVSSGAYDAHSSGLVGRDGHHNGGRFGDGFKRRFGSLRKKKDVSA